MVCAVCFRATTVFAEEISVSATGSLALLSRDVVFTPQAALAGWKGNAELSGSATNADGQVGFSLTFPNGRGGFDGTLRTKVRTDGRLAARWTLVPSTNLWLEECSVNGKLPCVIYAGGRIVADGRPIDLSPKKSDSIVLNRKVSELELIDSRGRPTMTMTFPSPQWVFVQDMRGFACDWFCLRLLAGHSFSAGQTVKFDFALAFPDREGAELTSVGKFVPCAGDHWLPVRLPSRIEPGSAADFSSLRGETSESPAGVYGYLTVRDGHFEYERLPGVVQRFYGINLCYDLCYPKNAAEAESLCSLLAASGYNAVRLHHYDRDLTGNGLVPKKGWLERMDFLVDACIRHGLLITTDLYCQRPTPEYKPFKSIVQFDEGAFSNQVAFVRMFLGHRNVLTGRRYAEEPAIALVSLVNEGMLAYLKTPGRTSAAYGLMNEQWNDWLSREHAAGRWLDVAGDLPEKEDAYGSARKKAGMRAFYAEKEDSFASRMKRIIRDELGCKALLSSLNCGDVPMEYASLRRDNFDYTDSHFYWDHPHFLKGAWWVPTRAGNAAGNPLRSFGAGRQSGRRFENQPLTWTEFNYCIPGRYRALSGLLTGANAVYDGWDGAWRFCWSESRGGETGNSIVPIRSWFSVANDMTTLASERAVAALYLRGDLMKGNRPFGEGDGFYVDAPAGSMTVKTLRTCGGFRSGGILEAGDIRVDMGQESGAVWVTSLSNNSIDTASRLLLTHLTDGLDSGMVFSDMRRIVMESYGSHPHLLRLGRAQISLRLAPGEWSVFALDSTGVRRQVIPAHYQDGRLIFNIDVGCRRDDATFLYEITKPNVAGNVAGTHP